MLSEGGSLLLYRALARTADLASTQEEKELCLTSQGEEDTWFAMNFGSPWPGSKLFIQSQCKQDYSWPLNNTSLNCEGPLLCGFFFNKYSWSFTSGYSINCRPKQYLWSPVGNLGLGPCSWETTAGNVKRLFLIGSWWNLQMGKLTV